MTPGLLGGPGTPEVAAQKASTTDLKPAWVAPKTCPHYRESRYRTPIPRLRPVPDSAFRVQNSGSALWTQSRFRMLIALTAWQQPR